MVIPIYKVLPYFVIHTLCICVHTIELSLAPRASNNIFCPKLRETEAFLCLSISPASSSLCGCISSTSAEADLYITPLSFLSSFLFFCDRNNNYSEYNPMLDSVTRDTTTPISAHFPKTCPTHSTLSGDNPIVTSTRFEPH